MVFFQYEPFGTRIEFTQHAVTASAIVNVNRKKGSPAHKVEEFVPEFKPQKEQTVDDMIGFAAMMTAAMGGKDLREER